MLTVSNTERDKVDALDAGADDYITKPFSMPGAAGAHSRHSAAACRSRPATRIWRPLASQGVEDRSIRQDR